MEKDRLKTILEDISDKLDLVLNLNRLLHEEMQSMQKNVNERFDRLILKLDALSRKIGDVEAPK